MKTKYLYYLIPLGLWALLALYTFSTMHSLSGDELYTIRDVLPFANRELAGPGASNVAFYGALASLFGVFGFDIYMPKYYRLSLELISLLASAHLLKKYLGVKWAIIPLITLGLSPTLLYWTTKAAPWGIDLQFFPICLLLFDTLAPNKKWTILTGAVLGGAVAMFSWLSYPAFMFYLPFLAWFATRKISLLPPRQRLTTAATAFGAFLLPLLALYFWVIKHDTLFYDPGAGRGLFTGGGAILFNEDEFISSTVQVFVNLFARATSYEFNLTAVEFSHIFPILTIVLVFVISFKLMRGQNGVKPFVFWCFATIAVNLIITGLTLDGSGMPGGRRNTPIVAAQFALWAVSWQYYSRKKHTWAIFVLSLLTIHHILAYPVNLAGIAKAPFIELPTWWNISDSPKDSLNNYLIKLQTENLVLDCEKQLGVTYPYCYYSSIWAILTMNCAYNNLECHEIQARFPYEKEYTTLNYELFVKEGWDR